MNPAAILGLIGDLYQRIAELTTANERLTEANANLAAELAARPPVPDEEAST